MNQSDQILAGQERLEKLLYLLIPTRKLPPDLQERAAHLLRGIVVERDERTKMLMKHFERLVSMTRPQRKNLKFPDELLPPVRLSEDDPVVELPIVPLSTLINRLANLRLFAVGPGEHTRHHNVIATLEASDLVTCTLHQCGLRFEGRMEVVMTRAEALRLNVPGLRKWRGDEASAAHTREYHEVAPEPPGVDEFLAQEAAAEMGWCCPSCGKPCDPSKGAECEKCHSSKQESFEESEAAQGVGTIPDRFDPADWSEDEEETEGDEINEGPDWDDFEDEDDQPEHHPFVDFDKSAEEQPKKVNIFVRKKK